VTESTREARVAQLERELRQKFGAEIKGAPLRQILGYSSGDAFRQAVRRGLIPVHTYVYEGRRARYATALALATWIESLEHAGKDQET
jgi:hypothetical protein